MVAPGPTDTVDASGFGIATGNPAGQPGGCTDPQMGTTAGTDITSDPTQQNQICWVAGVYNHDYTGWSDTDYFSNAGDSTVPGGHPFVAVTDFEMATTNIGNAEAGSGSGGQSTGAQGDAYEPIDTAHANKDLDGNDTGVTAVRVDVPPGVIANPQAVPQCPPQTLSSTSPPTALATACGDVGNRPGSQPSSQLGVVLLEVYGGGCGGDQSRGGSGGGCVSGNLFLGASVYNMDPGGTSGFCYLHNLPYASDFEFDTVAGPVHICGGIRSGSEDLPPNIQSTPSTQIDDGQYFEIVTPPPTPTGASSPAPQDLASPLVRSTLIFWGDPEDPAHQPQDNWMCPLSPSPCGPSQCQFDSSLTSVPAASTGGSTAESACGTNPYFLPPALNSVGCARTGSGCIDSQSQPSQSPFQSQPAGKPFISLPSGCVPAGQVTTVSLWDVQPQPTGPPAGDPQAQATSVTPVSGGIQCTSEPFNPSLTITADNTRADEPTGATIDLKVPQAPDATTQATSMLQSASVTLPPGMTLSPSAANGLKACTPAQFNESSDDAPTCPAASKVGTVSITSPLLPNPLTGVAYLGCDGDNGQTPCPNKDGSLSYLYIYVTAPAQHITQKLVGVTRADSATGQVTTTFDQFQGQPGLPQEPFSDFTVKLKGGPAAPLANPLDCGTVTMTSSLAPSSGNTAAHPTANYTVDKSATGGACASPSFSPTLSWSADSIRAGGFDNAFNLTFSRPDGQQYLSTLGVVLPPGLVGLIPSVKLCGEPQASNGTCASESQIGTVNVLAGTGSAPVRQTGSVYLTGPYGGAPFGLSVVVPAIAGPFNLGTVVTRAAINVDKTDAHLTVTSSLPQIVGGVPLRIRSATVTINRSDFVINPTSCQPLAITALMTSADGSSAGASDPFQVGDCSTLPFAPSLQLALFGPPSQMVDGGHPTLVATFKDALGQANVRDTTVSLPLSLALDPNNAQHVCSVAGSLQDQCPASTIIGNAVVQTPLLPQPLTGPVYLVQGIRTDSKGRQIRTLPTLLIPLRGEVAIDLRAQTSVDSAGRLVTAFQNTPDAAFSSFVLTISGGPRGILVVTGGPGSTVCKGSQIAPVHLVSQGGTADDLKVPVSAPCAGVHPVHGKRQQVHHRRKHRSRRHRSRRHTSRHASKHRSRH
jgi:hypothetical protein